jgi:energy-coupling factor transport system permease protein
MPLFLYIDRPTALHRLHPVIKLVTMLGLFLSAYLGQNPVVLLPLVAVVIGLLLWARALPNVYRLRVLLALVFVMTFIVWSLFYPTDQPWVAFGPLAISSIGIHFALGMAMKLTTFLAIGIVLLSTTKIEEFAYALTRVGMPYKLGFAMTLAFRLVPVFLDAAVSVVQAQQCRGFNFNEGGLWQRARRYVPVIVPVFMTALRRADGMAMALEARGFQSGRRRTVYDRYTLGVSDTVALLLVLGMVGLSILLWYRGYAAVSG